MKMLFAVVDSHKAAVTYLDDSGETRFVDGPVPAEAGALADLLSSLVGPVRGFQLFSSDEPLKIEALLLGGTAAMLSPAEGAVAEGRDAVRSLLEALMV